MTPASGGPTVPTHGPDAEARALELLVRDRVAFVLERPFLGFLAMRLTLQPVHDVRVPTAATDGVHLFFSAGFILSLSDDDRRFVLAHEVWHNALGHFERTTPGDREAWNLALDHEINALLAAEGLSVPAGAVLFPDSLGANAEQVYNALAGGALPNRGPGADVHLPASVSSADDGPFDQRFRPRPAALSRGEWRVWVATACARDRQAGRRTSDQVRLAVDSTLRPSLDWRAALESHLRRVAGGGSAWLPPNRRTVHRGLYLPSRRAHALVAVVAVDTSGSTLAHLPTFFAELRALLATFPGHAVTVLPCDDAVGEPMVCDAEHPLPESLPEMCGGGGTDFRPVFDWVDAAGLHPDVLVYLTDGYGPAPDHPPAVPVLWVLTPGGQRPAPWGATTFLSPAAAPPPPEVPRIVRPSVGFAGLPVQGQDRQP